ncbi:MAG: ATP-binding cassette domain-containing protein [Gemmatimonadales bacterium]
MSTDAGVIEARDLTKYYGETVGVEGLRFTVEPGEVFGFLGPNGSGKTTTIRLLLDLIRPARGDAVLFGGSPRDVIVGGRVGYLPGELTLDERLTGRQMLEFPDELRAPGTWGRSPRRSRSGGSIAGMRLGGGGRGIGCSFSWPRRC